MYVQHIVKDCGRLFTTVVGQMGFKDLRLIPNPPRRY